MFTYITLVGTASSSVFTVLLNADDFTLRTWIMQPTLATERLVIRPMLLNDASNVQKYAGDKHVALNAANIPYPYEDGMAEDWIGTHRQLFKNNEQVIFGIALKSDPPNIIGCIGLILHPEPKCKDIAEIGYWVAKHMWGQGIATEAGKRILEYGFKDLKLQIISANHYSRNPASGRIMQKLGMKYEGCLRRRGKSNGQFEDFEHYSILAEEYTQMTI